MFNKNVRLSILWDKLLLSQGEQVNNSQIYSFKRKIVINHLKGVGGNLLDIGFGYGEIEKDIIKNKLKLNIYGLDFSQSAINIARNNLTGTFRKGNILTVNYEDSFFDVILALDILEHFNEKECNIVLQKINRFLKSDGMLIVSVPLNETLRDYKLNLHSQHFSFKKMAKLLLTNNFSIRKHYAVSAFKRNFILKNVINKIFRIYSPNLLIIIAQK